ncbi:tRNA (adenosine(37)-N6)-threonylcarbamoyltransferase complex ATPase subunit type 1 TsaE [Marinilabiliaceae bacterium JC017]|nr:tRNA (adenosine(37)-N6)-threonylcarbamoyltransferase complex ATPase subunit type 1 TsaE [Marinilabiliaceae bacterium JC017]
MEPLYINSLDEIRLVAREFLKRYQAYRVLAFYGSMGVGKTTFIKALCQEMGVEDTVNSPSFAIVNEYHTKADDVIYHFDFYRIKKIEEAYDMGYEDYVYSGDYCLMEWPELIEDLLPAGRLDVTLTEEADGRRKISVSQR